MINVTKTFLPPFDEYMATLKKSWDKAWITNNGPLLQELELELREYLDVKDILVCSNGTVVLQMALKALQITGEVITTPFSYVATTNAIIWENCTPVFVDIDKDNFCIDPAKIEEAITPNTQAILATHVYGHPCDVDAIAHIAEKHHLKVIYDAAHAFGTKYNGRSVLNYGDVSTCSFHATKIFHTGEGGCVTTGSGKVADQLKLYRSFGHVGNNYISVGINAKNSELHAALGLCNLKYINNILATQKQKWEVYYNLLKNSEVKLLTISTNVEYNYGYFPVVFESETTLLKVEKALNDLQIFPRRYFYPALNTLNYIKYESCPVAESIAKRILCLPLYFEIMTADQHKIVQIILQNLS